MTDLLPDCPELRARAEAITRERLSYVSVPVGAGLRARVLSAVLAEHRDLSTPTGLDQGCRLLWVLLTGEEPEWCPAWHQREGVGFRISTTWKATEAIDFIPPGPEDVSGTFYAESNYVALAGADTLQRAEGLHAAITAVLDWRRGVSNG